MAIPKRNRASAAIPTASTADIAFLLIVFFLVTTSFSHDKGLGLTLPQSGAQTRVPSRNITKVLINSAGEIMHDQEIVTLEALGQRVKMMTEQNENMIVSIKTDPNARYESFVDVVDEIYKAGNHKISIAEPDMERETISMKSRFKKRSRVNQEIPTGSMGDISFLLIIFFMVTTQFVVYRGFQVDLPKAETIEPLKQRRNVASVWIGPDGRIMVDEFDVTLADVGNVVAQKLKENPRIVVQIKSDMNTPYSQVSGVIEQLRRVNAVRVSFIAKKE